MQLVLLEDDAKVKGFLLESFEREGFTTIPFSRFPDLKEYLSSGEPPADLVVLDRMVGSQDGAALIPLVKRQWPSAKILVLSAISDPEERAKVLDLGADDYQGKPYSLVELLSRVRALLRRQSDVPGPRERMVLHVGNLELQLLEHSAKAGKSALDLTPKEFRLLSILAREPGKVWSKFKLLDQVWQINLELESNVVESTVRNVRRKLEGARCTAVIESKRNLGYWIEAMPEAGRGGESEHGV